MVIDMNEAQVRTLEQVRQVLAGTQAMQFQAAADDTGRYAWIGSVLQRFDYRCLARSERGPVLAYLQRLSGYSRAQITRLVARWSGGQPLVKRYAVPRQPFARRYTPADVALLAEVDRAMCTLSGPATACVLRRQRDVFGDERYERLGSISVGHLYNLRHSAGYRNQRVLLTKTRPTKNTQIGVRKAPAPEGRPGLRSHRQRAPGRPGRHQRAVPHQRRGLRHPVAGSSQRADHFRGTLAEHHRGNAGAVPV